MLEAAFSDVRRRTDLSRCLERSATEPKASPTPSAKIPKPAGDCFSGRALLQEAAGHYDTPGSILARAARGAGRQDFVSGAEWMRLALGCIRGTEPPKGQANFRRLGVLKYAASAFGAALVLAGNWLALPPIWRWSALPLAVLGFYAMEAQWVFLFPVALDGASAPWRESRALMQRRAGTLAAMLTVLPLAWEMLTGGFRARGFVRSWCLGCLAVALWYERCRQAPDLTETTNDILPLDVAHRAPLLLRRETLRLPISEPLRCLLAPDLHLTHRREHLVAAIELALDRYSPDAVIFGGDFADSSVGLAMLAARVSAWTARGVPVLAVPGNHDRWLGLQRVRAGLLAAGAIWLPDGAFILRRADKPVLAFAALEAWPTANPGIPVAAALHDPAGFPAARARGAALVLAGHLHGCQCVGGVRESRLLPGAWFYPWNVLRHASGGAQLIVSRGCADTLPLRWRCPREIVLCELLPKSLS